MKSKDNVGHIWGVTQPPSHSDSPDRDAPRPADSAPFDMHAVLAARIGGHDVAISHVTLHGWRAESSKARVTRRGDNVTRHTSNVTRLPPPDGTLPGGVTAALAWLQHNEPDARHALLLHGIRLSRDWPPNRINLTTIRQYATRTGTTVVPIDPFAPGYGTTVLLLPAGRWHILSKQAWVGLACRLLFRDEPSDIVRALPLPRHNGA